MAQSCYIQSYFAATQACCLSLCYTCRTLGPSSSDANSNKCWCTKWMLRVKLCLLSALIQPQLALARVSELLQQPQLAFTMAPELLPQGTRSHLPCFHTMPCCTVDDATVQHVLSLGVVSQAVGCFLKAAIPGCLFRQRLSL